MKFTWSWLRAHLHTEASLTAITDKLTAIGLELESVIDPGAALAPFRVAQVISAEPHPNADRLRACQVDAGEGPVSVVCGAPNARAGMRAVFAPPGAYIPGTGITLKIGDIRGVTSAGMLLSTREMGLGEEHDGILELPADAPVGMPYAAYAGIDDKLIEIGVTPNRGDALGVRGVARDLAAAGMGTLKSWAPAPVRGEGPSPITWAVETPGQCPWILGRTVRRVRNAPSPDWLQHRLLSIGLRPINTLVDITNFFTFDLGRPLHVFDADKIAGGVLTLRPGAGETFRALNGRDYTVTPEDCVFTDAAGVHSLAGIMGGEATGCTEATTTVFLECALFDPVYVALAGRRHQIVSDARQRFERGIDPALLPQATEAATRMILELCGGVASDITMAGAEPEWQRTATMRYARLRTLGGADIVPADADTALEGLGFTIKTRDAERVTVQVPSWRNDIAARIALDQAPGLDPARAAAAAEGCATMEPEADLVEEVLRLRGLDSIPAVSLPRAAPVPGATLTSRQARVALARRTLAAAGLAECVTFSFMSSGQATLFGAADPGLRLANPIAADLDQMRPTPLATLALAAQRNATRGFPDAALFEIGPAFVTFSGGEQEIVAAGLLAGHTPRHPLAAAQPMGAMAAKARLFELLAALGLPMDSLSVSADAPGSYHPGRSGQIRQGPKLVLGRFGDLHPRVMSALDWAGPAAGFELFLDRVPEPKRRRKAVPDLPTFQPVRRDFAFVVASGTAVDALLRAARGAERAMIAGVSVFDVYEGDKVAAGQKSVGIEVVFQPRTATLTEAEIAAVADRVVAAVAKATGATLR